MRKLVTVLGLTVAMAGAIATAGGSPDWGWLFPMVGSAPASDPGDRTAYRVSGSSRTFTSLALNDLTHAVDWFPAEHPPMPTVVASGHDGANACGFCHLPDGSGRPENSALAGLSAAYIKRQVKAFSVGTRRAVLEGTLPAEMMAATAKAATPAEADQAADYFSRLRYTSHVHVVEAATLGFRPSRFVYVLADHKPQPIGDRIIEVPSDPAAFEQRDPHTQYTAFVPPGSIAAGRVIAATGGSAGQPCATCHGVQLRGGIAPALAGRSPTTLVRQLAAFKVGSRSNPEAAPMRAVTAQLDTRAMIAVAAYAGTLKP